MPSGQVWLISPWTIAEFFSALAIKERVGTISHQERLAALRAGDALHLAICRRSQRTLATMVSILVPEVRRP